MKRGKEKKLLSELPLDTILVEEGTRLEYSVSELLSDKEELLNKLIQMGWKPRGGDKRKLKTHTQTTITLYNDEYTMDKTYSIRDLVSIESGFRQFVVEKKLYKELCSYIEGNSKYKNIEGKLEIEFNESDYIEGYRYFVMLSSIQTDLEKFILDNVLIPTK